MSPPANEISGVVLASASATRIRLLTEAGVATRAVPANVDEDEIKTAMRADGASAAETAEALAETKALRISARCPDDFVIGGDQMLECEGRWFSKPDGPDEVRANLRALRGRSHSLVTSVVVARNRARLWHHTDTAQLTMRRFSDAFLEDYIAAAGEAALGSVGGYRLEGIGAQLFESVRGDFFTVLGLPLLPLLGFLRQHGVVAS